MKLYTAFLFFAVAHGFSAVAPKSSTAKQSAPIAVDKSMPLVDTQTEFDPTRGETAAMTRNNHGEVWLSQVSSILSNWFCRIK
jgi:hypothetical protein